MNLRQFLLLASCFALSLTAQIQPEPNLVGQLGRPLRYRPDGHDFVIENGAEFFNRPLYGGNTAFRVDGGDKPEFLLYLPGRGGNFRLGLHTPRGTKWLHDAAKITTRYRPGSLIYEVRDPLLGDGVLTITALALYDREGFIARVQPVAIAPGVELICAFGGVTGKRGRRDGDIGTESVPIGEYFQFQPDFARDNAISAVGNTFKLASKPATLVGTASPEVAFSVAEAAGWNDPTRLVAGTESATELPVAIGRTSLRSEKPIFIAIERLPKVSDDRRELATYEAVRSGGAASSAVAQQSDAKPAASAEALGSLFTATEKHFDALRRQITIESPDPFLNAAVAALNVAADAVWDEPQGVVMHGAVAWRSKLLGWRGPYAMDALGWHDRARRHLTYWSKQQNTAPIPEQLPPPDENANLARSEAALHSNGDMSKSHYDMNLVYIDALFRHLLWTGDLAFAREVWPVIQRHLAWEKRLFRREFTTAAGEKLPLYEAYAAIWASDDLQYHGGGAAHASAYNYYHNKMAARLARLIQRDDTAYEREAKLIARGIRELLWMPDRGMFAEFKDYLGLQRLHPSAGLWTFYHTIDSELTTPEEAIQMTRYVEREIPRLPVHGPGVPSNLDVLSTTNWMPYTWSINNVVMGENIHTALAFWQAGRAEEAYRLTKSGLTASMFMGISPGNVGSMNYLDVYRRESQRDFGDGSGVTSRALVEGLFGIRPDLLAGELVIAPGFPRGWDHARIHHPDIDLSYKRSGSVEHFSIQPRLEGATSVILQLPARGQSAVIRANGRRVNPNPLPGPAPRLAFVFPAEPSIDVVIEWNGVAPSAEVQEVTPVVRKKSKSYDWSAKLSPSAQLTEIDLSRFFNDSVTQIFKNEYRSPRSPFASLAIPKQGIGAWAGHVNATAEIDDSGLRALAAENSGRLTLPNGLPFATPASGKNILFTSQWDNYPREATVPLSGRARHVFLLMAGSTNWMQSRIDNGEVIVTYTDGSTARLALENPTTWWPIDQDYFIDDYQFQVDGPLPPRVDLKTGAVRLLDRESFKGKGGVVPGGAATALELALDPAKELQSLTVRTLSNEVVIGLMAATLVR